MLALISCDIISKNFQTLGTNLTFATGRRWLSLLCHPISKSPVETPKARTLTVTRGAQASQAGAGTRLWPRRPRGPRDGAHPEGEKAELWLRVSDGSHGACLPSAIGSGIHTVLPYFTFSSENEGLATDPDVNSARNPCCPGELAVPNH